MKVAFQLATDWASNHQLAQRECAEQRFELAARPRFVIVDPTSRCNARCVMCHVSFRPPTERGQDLSMEVFEKLAPLFRFASHINLFATGEPTVAREILHIIRETRRRAHAGTQLWLCTNGKRIPAEVLAAIAGDPRFGLQFSVDGGSKEVFEAVRRGITWEELCASLSQVQTMRQGGRTPPVTFSCTMSKRNLADLVNIFALAKQYEVDRVRFYDEDPEVPAEEAFVLDERDRPVFEAQRAAIEASGVPFVNELTFRGPRAAETAPPHCRAPWNVFYVQADGDVRTCCTLRQSMGNLSSSTVEEIWNGPAYVALRRALVEGKHVPAACLRCTDPLRTWG